MTFPDLFHETFLSLGANKTRSGLTMLGIVIGIASVIAMVSIGQGAQKTIQSSIEGLGANLLTVLPGFIQPGRGIISSGRGSATSLITADADSLVDISGIAYLSPELTRRFQIAAGAGTNTNTTVIGVAHAYPNARNVSLASGSFITEAQERGLKRVVVLGPTVASDLFGEQNPVGETIRLNRMPFTVIGTLQSKGSAGFFNPDDAVFIPLSTMQKILAGVDSLSALTVSVDDKSQMNRVRDEITLHLAQRHRVDPEQPDFSIVSQSDILGTLTQVTTTFTLFLASIAGISLLVGGIGIMNMMLTVVTERTREIGLRKAIGARRRDITLQFLSEAVLLTFFGGLIGVILGWLIALGVSRIAGIATDISPFSVFLAFGVSAAIGIIFGYYPARRAARLNPIEALRYE